jgi:hypothetical protein
MSREVRMINSARSLDSMRNLGIDLEMGLMELIDNSIDASAENIRMHIGKSSQGNLMIIVADDGVGIPEESPGREHIENTVQHVLRFGGKIAHKGSKFPIGRFGFGLSQTVLCLTTRSTVYSKCLGRSIRTCYFDLELLKQTDAQLPDETTTTEIPEAHTPENWNLGEKGTLVVLEDIDKAGWKQPRSLQKHLIKEIGRIYRRSIASGLKISISVDSKGEVVDVLARDPICQLPYSREVETFGVMPTTATCKLIFDGKDLRNLPIVIDPNTGAPAIIHVRMVKLDVQKIYEILEIELTTGTPKNRKRLTEWGIGLEGQGFSVMRNGRELRHSETLDCFSKASTFNYFRGEVEFPTCLDRYFNVQTIQGRYSLESGLRDALTNRCNAIIKRIAKETSASLASIRVLHSPKSDSLESEVLTQSLRKVLKRKPISPEAHQQKRMELETRKNGVIGTVDREADARLQIATDELRLAKINENKDEIRLAEAKFEVVKEDTIASKKAIRNRFQVDVFCRKWVKPLRDGVLYAVEDYHDEIWVTINSESDFFQSLYERASQYPEQASLLDLIIFSIAYSEADQSNSEEMKLFWRDVRRNLSKLTYLFVNMVQFEEDLPNHDQINID